MPETPNYWATLKDKYDRQANPNKPTMVTGQGDTPNYWAQLQNRPGGDFIDAYNRNTLAPTQVHGETEDGMFAPDLGRLYDEYDEANPSPETPGRGIHRTSVARAMQENLNNEGFLREFDIEVPPVEIPERAWYHPLEMLTQLQRGQFAIVGGLKGILDGYGGESALKNFYRGLILKEEHSVGDIIERYNLVDEDNAAGRFIGSIAGDILLDPLTWFTFGASGAARASVLAAEKGIKGFRTAEAGLKAALTGQGFKKLAETATVEIGQAEFRKVLGKFGNDALDKAIAKVGDQAGMHSLIVEIANRTKLGKKLLPHGLRFQHWVPSIGGKSIEDLGGGLAKQLGLKRGLGLTPGGIVQRIDDIDATQSILNKIGESLAGTSIGKFGGPVKAWFGRAFVPHYNLLKSFPELAELQKALRYGNQEEARVLLEKGREIAKLVKDPKERELIEEILDNPLLLGGRHLVKLRKVDNELWADVNTDWWPQGTKLTEQHAEDIIDMYFEEMRRAFSQGHGDDLATYASDAQPGYEVATGLTHLGAGAYGEVVKPAILQEIEYMRPIIQSVINGKIESRFTNFKFGDWVIKLPSVPSRHGMQNIKGAYAGGTRALGISKLQPDSMITELYIMRKLGNAPYSASGQMVWRRASDLAPETRGANLRAGQQVEYGQMYTFEPGHADTSGAFPLSLHGESRYSAIEGGYHLYKKEGGELSKSAWYKSVRDTPIHQKDLPVPILIKKFIPGKTVKAWGEDLVTRTISQNLSDLDLVTNVAKVVNNVMRAVRGISKHGIGMDDVHSNNMMINKHSGKAVWIDAGSATDYNISGNLSVRSRGRLYDQGLQTTPQGDRILGLIKKPKEALETTTVDRLAAAHRQALLENVDSITNQMDGPIASLIEDFGKALRTKYTNSDDIERVTLLFLQKLKAQGVIKEYKKGGYLHHDLVTAGGMSEDVFNSGVRNIDMRLQQIGGGLPAKSHRMTDAVQADSPDHFGVIFANDDAFQAITSKNLVQEGRVWEEITEIVTSQHPKLAEMSSVQYERVMKAYNLTKEWKGVIARTLKNRQIVSSENLKNFMNAHGLNKIQDLRHAKDPFTLLSRLNLVAKGRRTIAGMSQADAIVFAKDLIPKAKKAFGFEFHEGDIVTSLTKHAIDVAEASGTREIIDFVAKKWAKPVNVQEATRLVGTKLKQVTEQSSDPGWQILKNKGLEGLQIPNEVAESLKRYNTIMIGDEATRTFFKTIYDPILNIWKGYATFMNTGFHGRNLISNMFQLYLKDGPMAINPNAHRHVVAMLMGKKGSITLNNGAKVTYDEFMDMARRQGVYGTSWSATDIENVAKSVGNVSAEVTGKGMLNPVSKHFVGAKVGRKVGQTIENESKLVGFYNDLVRTGNESYSAMNTKKYLFDYGDLTDFEKNLMKRIFPFYTWMRKNIALQFEQMMKQPAKYGNVARFKTAVERASPGVDDRWAPTHFPELYAIRTPLRTGQGSPLYLNPNLPFQDLHKAFSPRDWVSSIAPWKVIFEFISNKNFFSDQPIERYKGEMAPIEWLSSIQKSDNRLAGKIADLIGAKQIYEPETEQWVWGLPPKVKYAIEQASPFLRNIDRLTSFAVADVPSFRKEKRPWDAISKLFGVKFLPYNVKSEFERRTFERRDVLRDLIKSKKKQGLLPSPDQPDVEPPPR